MNSVFIPFISAFWLGILTSISPCPLATNIAAVSFLSKKIIHPKAVLISGVLLYNWQDPLVCYVRFCHYKFYS